MTAPPLVQFPPNFHPCARCLALLDACATRPPSEGLLYVPLLGRGGEEGFPVRAWTIVLDDDISRGIVAMGSWGYAKFKGPDGYVSRLSYSRDRRQYLHQVVHERYHGPIVAGLVVDHIDRNKLNNTPGNLRLVSVGMNNANQSRRKDNSSGFKNVFWHKLVRKWLAKFNKNGTTIELGYFATAREAADAVNEAYRIHYPEIVTPNP